VTLQKRSMPVTCTPFSAVRLGFLTEVAVAAPVDEAVAAGSVVRERPGFQRVLAPDDRPECLGFCMGNPLGAEPSAPVEDTEDRPLQCPLPAPYMTGMAGTRAAP
jgi:hypothetical protein